MAARANPERNKRTLPHFIAALLDPSSYPHPVGRIELRQTHISYVFLTGAYVYKIKKPVNFGFVDYSTLEKREHYCREEVRLNSRLCPEIYLGVVEVRETDGQVRIGAGNHLIDYAVKMVQLPDERIMDRLLEQGLVTDDMIRRLAAKLVEFYRHAKTGPSIQQYGVPMCIAVNTNENFVQTAPYVGRIIPASQYELIKQYTDEFLAKNQDLFERRIQGGYVREGHGDLRPESICFRDGICIFDCVEFNERLRCGDVASDIAFLVMEMEKTSHFDLARQFIDAYVQHSGDKGILEVLNFYKIYRAYVRGKVECFKVDEPEIPDEEKSRSIEAARHYFDLATFYIGRR